MSAELSGRFGTATGDQVSGTGAITGIEGTLLAAAKDGDSAAFGDLFVANKDKILRLAQRIIHNGSDAEEVVQDAFTQAFVHLDGFHGDSRFTTWLTRIAVNQALMMLRKRQSRVASLGEPLDIDRAGSPQIRDRRLTPEQDYSQRERRRILSKAISRLNPNLRAVVQLQLTGLSDEESARELGVSKGTVKSRLYRARTKLRKALGPHFRPAGFGEPQCSHIS